MPHNNILAVSNVLENVGLKECKVRQSSLLGCVVTFAFLRIIESLFSASSSAIS